MSTGSVYPDLEFKRPKDNDKSSFITVTFSSVYPNPLKCKDRTSVKRKRNTGFFLKSCSKD